MNTNKRNLRILEARQKWDKVLKGDLRARAEVMETMTTSDFPVLLGAAYGRELDQEYQGIAPVWQQFATRKVVPDFRERSFTNLLGGRAELDKVKEASEYTARSVKESSRKFKVDKYGNRIPLTWEMLKNDDLDAFRDLPQRLAVAARETEDRVALLPLFNTAKTGLNTGFFTADKRGTDALTSESLEAALTAIATRTDGEGRPIILTGATLLVPPALEMTARRILNATEIRRTEGGVTTIEPNYMRGVVNIVVDPWLPIVASGYTNVNSSWFVLPATSVPNPALVQAFMTGEETPDLRVKADAGNALGGGTLSPETGSFDDDTVQYRVRHIMGSASLYNDAVFASDGTTPPSA